MASTRTFLDSLEQFGIKLGLEQIRRLLTSLGHPDRHYISIIVAGTNGKGSVTAMIERGLRAAGYRTGRFTSPHLVRLEERFAIDGEDVASPLLDDALARVEHAAGVLPVPPTFFEATTAVALDLFRTQAVQVAVLEVGLGGRLDATNAVNQVAAAVTAVDMDHQQWLGETVEAIAREKAGVIKGGTFVVLGRNSPVVERVVADRCRLVGADLVPAASGTEIAANLVDGRAVLQLQTPNHRYPPLTLGLRGRHQVHNAVTAVRLLEELDVRRVSTVPADAIRTAVEDAIWPARLELFRAGDMDVLLDGAHNAAGASALAAYLRETYGGRLPVVLGIMRDKDVAAVVSALVPQAACVVCTAPDSPRALPASELAAIVSRIAPDIHVMADPSPQAALARAADRGTPVVVAGSLYLAGEIRALLS